MFIHKKRKKRESWYYIYVCMFLLMGSIFVGFRAVQEGRMPGRERHLPGKGKWQA